METFIVGDYYKFNVVSGNFNKLYTAHVVAVDDTHVSIIDATGEEVVLFKNNITGECRKITQARFEQVERKIAMERRQKELTKTTKYEPTLYRP